MDYDDQLTGLATPSVVTSGGVISLGRRKYAVGLYWQPSPSGRVSQAAREAARQPGQMADFFAVRPGTAADRVPQFGLGQKEFGHTAGLPTGAASLAEEQPGSWGGVFKVPEGWWVVVSRDDLIAPDGDILYANESDARQRLQDEIELGGLQRIYAPDTWGVANADPMPLSLLMQGRAEARLQNVHLPIRTYMIAASGILFLCVVGYLVFLWQQAAEEERRQQQLSAEQKVLAEIQRQAQLAPTAPPPPPKREWENQPLGDVWLDACRNALSKVPARSVGWKFNSANCANGALTVVVMRDDGPAEVPKGAALSSDGRHATVVVPFIGIPSRGTESLRRPGSVDLMVLNNNLPVEIVTEAESKEKDNQLRPWLKKKITIKGQTAPWFNWEPYVRIPGLVIDKVTWTGTDWTTEGTLYELR